MAAAVCPHVVPCDVAWLTLFCMPDTCTGHKTQDSRVCSWWLNANQISMYLCDCEAILSGIVYPVCGPFYTGIGRLRFNTMLHKPLLCGHMVVLSIVMGGYGVFVHLVYTAYAPKHEPCHAFQCISTGEGRPKHARDSR